MPRSRISRYPLAGAVVAFAAHTLVGCGKTRSETEWQAGPPQDARAGSSGSGGSNSDATGEPDALDASDASAPEASICPPPLSGAIPSGWAHFPGVSCDCDIWVAVTAEQMEPAPSWITRPSGVIELENNWADFSLGVIANSAAGDFYGGERLIAYRRELGPIGSAASVHEQIVLRLPANEIVFRARQLGGASALCQISTRLGQGNVLHQVVNSRDASVSLAVGRGRIGSPDPVYTLGTLPHWYPNFANFNSVIGRSVIGYSYRTGPYQFPVGVIPLGVPNPPSSSIQEVMTSGWGTLLLFAWDATLFYDVNIGHPLHEISALDQARGRRIFLGSVGGSAPDWSSPGGLCTDGETMVWTQYSNVNSSASAWTRADMMKAPFTTDESAVQPVSVRSDARSSGRMGGGYAAANVGVDAREYSIVRLSDGRVWTLANPPGTSYGAPLYVTDEEVSMVETALSEAGTLSESRAIVRYPLALLGPGTPWRMTD